MLIAAAGEQRVLRRRSETYAGATGDNDATRSKGAPRPVSAKEIANIIFSLVPWDLSLTGLLVSLSEGAP